MRLLLRARCREGAAASNPPPSNAAAASSRPQGASAPSAANSGGAPRGARRARSTTAAGGATQTVTNAAAPVVQQTGNTVTQTVAQPVQAVTPAGHTDGGEPAAPVTGVVGTITQGAAPALDDAHERAGRHGRRSDDASPS